MVKSESCIRNQKYAINYYSESCIRNQKYAINYSFMLSASMAVTTVLACAQMILKFNGKVKSQLITQSVMVEQSRN